MKPLKIILAGGTGTMGRILQDHFGTQGADVVVLTRGTDRAIGDRLRYRHWDGRTSGGWADELEGATAVINLAGRSVDCRYTARNKAQIRSSRVDATNVLGEAIARCTVPPPVWINLSTATIYRHAEDRPMDQLTGEIGSGFSVSVAQAWEAAFFAHQRAGVRQVAVRCAMVFDRGGGAFPRFTQFTRIGLGGHHGSGDQYVSWVHGKDVARFFHWLIDTPAVSGVIDLAAPHPVPEKALMRELRIRLRPLVAFHVPRWMLGIGAFLLRTETELVLKSRRVVPTRALQLGFTFHHPTITSALDELCAPRAQHVPA
ncbi:MAG TPA: TIGR01777 family oxidoreductase [Flavobacteriales bacterium]|jgi:hypothetical protein|nr:TIGR01777 family oxidoreductase [Flavobacteriales bacterium]